MRKFHAVTSMPNVWEKAVPRFYPCPKHKDSLWRRPDSGAYGIIIWKRRNGVAVTASLKCERNHLDLTTPTKSLRQFVPNTSGEDISVFEVGMATRQRLHGSLQPV